MKGSNRYIEIENINIRTLENLINDLPIYTELYTNEHSDPNHNCDISLHILTKCKNEHMPKKRKKLNKRKEKRKLDD